MRLDRAPTAVTRRAWAQLLSRTLLRRFARHAARRLPRPSLAGFVVRLAPPEHARHPASRLRTPTCVRVQVHQLSWHQLTPRCGVRPCPLRAAAKLHNALFCAMAAPLFARNDRPARTEAPGLLAAKPALCKMAAAGFV
jgi:hypothetical protein